MSKMASGGSKVCQNLLNTFLGAPFIEMKNIREKNKFLSSGHISKSTPQGTPRPATLGDILDLASKKSIF